MCRRSYRHGYAIVSEAHADIAYHETFFVKSALAAVRQHKLTDSQNLTDSRCRLWSEVIDSVRIISVLSDKLSLVLHSLLVGTLRYLIFKNKFGSVHKIASRLLTKFVKYVKIIQKNDRLSII